MKNEDVPALINYLRRRPELTQEQFAQKIGIPYDTVNRWKNGRRVPMPFLLRRLLDPQQELGSSGRSRRARS